MIHLESALKQCFVQGWRISSEDANWPFSMLRLDHVEIAFNVRPAATCPLAYGHLPPTSYCLLKIPSTSYWACLASVKYFYVQSPNFDQAFLTYCNSTTLHIWLGGGRGRVGSDFEFLEHSCAPVSLPSYLTWQGYSDTATGRSTDKGGRCSQSLV